MPGLAALSWRLWRTAANTTHQAVVVQPVRVAAVACVVGSVWILLGCLFYGLIEFLNQEQYLALKPRLLESLLSLFFFTMGVLVLVSDTVLVWGALFRTRAAQFHAALPVIDRHLFWHASIEGGLWASWAVLVLVAPLVGVLATEAAVPLLFIPAALATLLALIGLGMAGGALGALLLARVIPTLRRGIKGIIILVLIALAITALVVVGGIERDKAPATFMAEVIGRLQFAEHPLLPSWWAQQAMSGALAARWSDWLWFTGLLASNAAGIAIVAEWVAHRRLRRDLDALSGRPEPTDPRGATRPWRPLPGMAPELGLLVAKDLRLFKRDPAQVLQFTAFFGLLTFYMLMLPRLGKAFAFDEWWRPAVSVLNLTAIGMALATFTGRFVFPLLSLEGRRLWVLALAPWPRERVVTAKFIFALLIGVPVSVALAILSGCMLELPARTIAYQALVIAAMAVGLSACALGIGARLADYREDDPNRLVAGYGGTVNLLASLVFAGLLLLGAALPIAGRGHQLAWVGGLAWTLLLTTTWTLIFLGLARRWFGRLEDRPSNKAA